MLSRHRYERFSWQLLDYCSYCLMYPFLITLSFFAASYIPCSDKESILKYLKYFVCGPFCLICCILCFPFGLAGILLWIFICHLAEPKSYSYYESNSSSVNLVNRDGDYTIATANVCLLPEAMTKLNNNSFYITRAVNIAKRILLHEQQEPPQQTEKVTVPNELSDDFDHSIITRFPNVDFLCLQEVWERVLAWIIIYILSSEFKYFLYDIGKFHWHVNGYCLGSGLMFISKYPILDVQFHAYNFKTLTGSFTSLGLLQVKVFLGYTDTGKQQVGYISTTHLQSYQGQKPCILNELTEAKKWLEDFKNESEDEVIAFDFFCGDFNFDNISPGDQSCTTHPIFEDYEDICRIGPGEDHIWSIGTEMRQIMMWDDLISTPEKFKKVLEDPVLRRYFILDADVKIHTMELAVLLPPFDEYGKIESRSYGGKRRVDYILYHKKFPLKVLKYNFVTALNQLTDHLPVVMKFRPQKH